MRITPRGRLVGYALLGGGSSAAAMRLMMDVWFPPNLLVGLLYVVPAALLGVGVVIVVLLRREVPTLLNRAADWLGLPPVVPVERRLPEGRPVYLEPQRTYPCRRCGTDQDNIDPHVCTPPPAGQP